MMKLKKNPNPQVTVFFGLTLASLLFSGSGDKWGRKPVALTGAAGVTVSFLLCGFVKCYWELVVLQGLVGVFLGVAMGPSVALTG